MRVVQYGYLILVILWTQNKNLYSYHVFKSHFLLLMQLKRLHEQGPMFE